MCAACEFYEINLVRQRMAARMRERMRAEAVEAEAGAPAAPPQKSADEPPAGRRADGVNV